MLESAAGAPLSLRAWPPETQVAPGWRPLLHEFLRSADGQRVAMRLRADLAVGTAVFPPEPLRALRLTAPEEVRVVILGQDPYHGPGQAYGLAFAVPEGVKVPPSLRNIFKELQREFGAAPHPAGLLDHWARQGVLLLNTSLTVAAGQAGSHSKIGWQGLTGAIFQQLVTSRRPLVFMLWGAHAHAMCPQNGAAQRHLWLLANHPSPLSALRPPVPFIGCGHFASANDFLREHGDRPIDWLGSSLPEGSTPLARPGQLVA
ncbi:uracil-DNA glycosylase [Ottowia testudinis]|uniref:Uracil-DNA glycosylase n=2 Tax=Ottowia testudinis TaxID=2816950 RepID=A0A975H522_9BURK|nr:uracil-DNA glycosylase [Ottowia testudinis]QTD47478.1 uracil-DNA glycosylase [Ottowia testudinis]